MRNLKRAILVALASGAAMSAVGQPVPRDSVVAALRQGVAEYESGNTPLALPILEGVVRTDSSALDPALGSAAYWLGLCYWEADRREDALKLWARAWLLLGSRGLVDLPLGDRLLWGVFDEWDEPRFDLASEVYGVLLQHLESSGGERTRGVGARILVPLWLVLPDSLREVTGLVDEASAVEGRLGPRAGARLVEWWRSMDALPATEENERLVEHLQRVSIARKRFRSTDSRGFDDRGAVYIRFGAPGRKTTTRINPFDIGQSHVNTLRGVRTGVAAGTIVFPRNEFWVYPAVDRTAQYLFVEAARGAYRLGTMDDLIPRYLWGPRYSRIRLKVLETVLRDLALYHPLTYSSWYEDVATHVTDLELSELSAQTDRRFMGPAGSVGFRSLYSPGGLVDYYVDDHRMEESRAIRDRDRDVPRSFFDDFGEVQVLGVAVRTARFLDTDGTTRLEVYWTFPTSELAEANRRLNGVDGRRASDYLVQLTLAELDSLGRRLGVRVDRRRVENVAATEDAGVLYPQQLTVDDYDPGNRLKLQWDALAEATDEKPLRHPKVAMAVAGLDALPALRSDRRTLEMSDLRPVLVDPSTGESGPAYPGRVLTPDMRIGLEFELYHLTFGPDDRTRYSVAYEIDREDDLAFRTRALQESPSQVITASTSYQGVSSTEREKIVLDLSEWNTAGRMRIIVRVRDETSGQEVQRSLAFELEPRS